MPNFVLLPHGTQDSDLITFVMLGTQGSRLIDASSSSLNKMKLLVVLMQVGNLKCYTLSTICLQYYRFGDEVVLLSSSISSGGSGLDLI